MEYITVNSHDVLRLMHQISLEMGTLKIDKQRHHLQAHLPKLSAEDISLCFEYLAQKGYISRNEHSESYIDSFDLTASGVDKVEGLIK